MNNMRKKILMTLALLITAVGGAWAGGLEGRTFVDFKIEFRDNPYKVILPTNGELPAGVLMDGTTYNGGTHGIFGGTITVPVDGPVKFTIGVCQYSQNEIVVKKDGEAFTTVNNQATCGESSGSFAKYVTYVYNGKAATLTFEFIGNTYIPYFFAEAVEGSIEVTWDAKAQTGTFVMPAFDVEIAPIYAPEAQWAIDKEVKQLPTAAEGIFAESNDSIVTPGTVATGQGTVMYAVTSTNQATAPELSAFSADLPRATEIKTGGDVLVWYYIKGADTPEGQEASAENTFNDSEIASIQVTVLSNKFDITLSPAPVKNMTVTVAGQAKTPDQEGKVEAVKMESEVKLKANTGYKFRKVEVKKKAKTITIGGTYSATLDIEGCTTWQQVVEKNSTLIRIWDQNYITNLGTYMVLMKGNNYVAPGDNIDPTATDYTFVDAPF